MNLLALKLSLLKDIMILVHGFFDVSFFYKLDRHSFVQWVGIDNAGSCVAPQQATTYSMPKKKFNLAVCFGTQ